MTTIEIPKFIEKYKVYEQEGDMIDFRIFQLDTKQDDTPYQKHLAVAQQTLISVAEEANTRLDRMAAKLKMNRRELFTMDYDFNILKDSGKEISVQDFMGWQYEEISGSVILEGRKLYNQYFCYDDKEVSEKAVTMTEEDLKKEAFAYAFFQPRYSFMITKSNFEKGIFFRLL